MKPLKIVFMGTPYFAVHCLEKILESPHNVVGVITAPDKPAGRGRKLQRSAVKEFAETNDLKVLQPTNLKSEEFLKDLKALNADIQVVVAFRMLPKLVWNMPPMGTFNLHASLLPQYRGAAPLNWAIINGERKTGVSTFFLDEKIDTGAIILQDETEISENETAGSLHDKLMESGAQLILETLNLVANGKAVPQPQPPSEHLKEAPKLDRENTKINWSDDLKKIHDHIRGLNPYPAAWCYLEDKKVKIFNCSPEFEKVTQDAGTILVEEKSLKVATKDGYLIIDELQLPGKRKMKVKDLLNGYKFAENATFR